MNDIISKPTTRRSEEDRENYEQGWDRVFGQKRREMVKLHSINSKRHRLIESIQAKGGRTKERERELLKLKREREKVLRRLDKLDK